jgi:hypothetical protein
MPKAVNRHIELHALLTQLNLGTMADVCADVALRAAKEGLSHEAYLYELARLEMEQRTRAFGLLAWCVLPDCQWRRRFGRSRSADSLQPSNCNWNASKALLSWRARRILSPLANQVWGKVTLWQRLGMS